MIKIKESTNTSISIKNVYMSGENLMLDEFGEKVDLYGLISKTYGDGVEIEIKINYRSDKDMDT